MRGESNVTGMSAVGRRLHEVVAVMRSRDLRGLQLGWTAFFLVDGLALVALFALFANIPLFAPLPPTTIEKLAARCTTVDVPPGTVIIREGDAGDRFYGIVQGEVDVSRGGVSQRTLGPGGHFGEIALLRDVNRTATVVARSRVRVASLDTSDFLDSLTSSETAYGIAWRTTSELLESHAEPESA